MEDEVVEDEVIKTTKTERKRQVKHIGQVLPPLSEYELLRERNINEQKKMFSTIFGETKEEFGVKKTRTVTRKRPKVTAPAPAPAPAPTPAPAPNLILS